MTEVKKQGPKGPTKYTPEFLDKEAHLLIKWSEEQNNIYLRDFAHERGYHPSRLHEFAEVNANFSRALERAKDNQERKFLMMALSKEADMSAIKYFLPRILQDRPYLKASWDSQEQVTQIQAPSVTINKIYKKGSKDAVQDEVQEVQQDL